MRRITPELEHPAQGIVSAFLRALADDDAAGVFDRLSLGTRGRLEGLHAARTGLPLHAAANGAGEVVAPLRASALAALGGPERIGRFGVSGARVIDRATAYVLLIPEIEREGLVTEEEWRPAHLIALVHEARDWRIDLARTAELSVEAGLPDPLGAIT